MSFVLLFLLNFLFSSDHILLSIDEFDFSLQDFYTTNPKNQWVRSDSIKQERLFNDFIKRNLMIVEAKSLGFMNDPEIYSKIKIRSNQLLINETYEQLVAIPLIDSVDLNLAKIYAKKELLLHHVLIGHETSYLASPPKRSIDEALLLSKKILHKYNEGLNFNALAIEFSDDPSAQNNQGLLGWVEWGLTASEFQLAAFQLNKNEISEPILTPFGYHLIFVEDVRLSDYNKMNLEEFNSSIINLSKRTVRNKLRAAAATHDSLALLNNNVVFNLSSINNIVSSYNGLKSSGGKINKNISVINVVDRLIKKNVLFVKDGFGFGPMWLINKLKDVPISRHPVFDTSENTIAILNNFILQDIAIINGKKHDIINSFSFKKRQENIINSLLYDAYLKHIINSTEKPDSTKIKKYYKSNAEKYLTKQSFLIDELRFRSKLVADSLKNIISNNESLSLYENKNLKIVYNNNLSIAKNSHPALYDMALSLEKGEMSPVLSSFGGNFSIFKINKKIPPSPQKLSSVYSKVESTLLKEKQNKNKRLMIDDLKNKYKIKINKNLFPE